MSEDQASLGLSRSSSASSLPEITHHLQMSAGELESLARVCLQKACGAAAAAATTEPSNLEVKERVLQGLWSGIGNVTELTIRSGEDDRDLEVILKSILLEDATRESEMAVLESYRREAAFFVSGFASRVLQAGAICPKLLYFEASWGNRPHGMLLAVSKIPGKDCRKLGYAAMVGVLTWLATLHATFWGISEEDARKAGLNEEGCYWSLRHCRDEEADNDVAQVENNEGEPPDLLNQRLQAASASLDWRLRNDEFQTICHGDPKDHNVLVDELVSEPRVATTAATAAATTASAATATSTTTSSKNVEVSLIDYQWTGRGSACKDVAYCLICAAGTLRPPEEEAYLNIYYEALSSRLRANSCQSLPAFEAFRSAYRVALADLARWMSTCPYGWWGHGRVLQVRAIEVLQELDGGKLATPEEYEAAMGTKFPLESPGQIAR